MDKIKRAELKRAYKESRRPAGVYQIRNTVTGKVFIGSSVDVPARINRHKTEFWLDPGNNSMGAYPELLADSRKYGPESFTFEVLEILDGDYETDAAMREDLQLFEEMWLEKCEPYGDNGYNTRKS